MDTNESYKQLISEFSTLLSHLDSCRLASLFAEYQITSHIFLRLDYGEIKQVLGPYIRERPINDVNLQNFKSENINSHMLIRMIILTTSSPQKELLGQSD